MRQVVGGWSYDTREAFDRGMVIILVWFSSWLESRVGWGTWLWQSTDDSNTFHCTKSFSCTTESSKSSRTSASFHHTVVDQLQRDLKKEDRAILAIKKINLETVTLVVFGHWRLSSWASHAWDLDMIWERLDVKEPRLLNGCSRISTSSFAHCAFRSCDPRKGLRVNLKPETSYLWYFYYSYDFYLWGWRVAVNAAKGLLRCMWYMLLS